MSKSNSNKKLSKILEILGSDKGKHIANVIDKISIKESDLIRPIVPVEEWINSDYYVGRDARKLYPFWKDLICSIFSGGKQNYTQIVLTGGIGCRPVESTLYETSSGLLSLKEIQNRLDNNECLEIHTEVGSEKIIATHIIGEKNIITLTLSDGTVFSGSYDHLLKVFDGKSILFKKLCDISENDHILKSIKKKPEYNNTAFSENEAYFTGSILGDGSITKYGNFSFMWGDELEGADDIEETIKAVLPTANVHHRCTKNNYKLRSISLHNYNVYDKLFGKGNCYNSHTKELPSWIFSCSDRIKWQLIAGLFDTDGHISKRGNIGIGLVSCKMITQLKCLLHSLGVASKQYAKQKKYKDKYFTVYGLEVSDIRSKKLFKDNCPLKLQYKKLHLANANSDYNRNCRTTLNGLSSYMRTLPHIVIPRHLDALKVYRRNNQEMTYETLLKYKTYYKDWVDNSEVLSYIINNECEFVEVVNKNTSVGIVGDIEVEGSHTYISDGGLINHNTGKSTCALYIALRKLYELSCYSNIAGLFNMMSNSFTAFLYFSLTKYQAERTGFAQLRSIIDGIPYFNELFQRNKYRNSTLDFPENLRIFYGSSTGDMIGMNCICVLIDEANFFDNSSSGGSGVDVDLGSVGELYNSVLSRTSSRYTSNGVNHSLNIVISSSTFKSSLTSQLYEKSLTDPSIKYARARLWDIKPKGTYTDEYFYVFAGNEKFDPFIIDSTDTLCVKLGISLDPSLSVKDAIAHLSQEYRLLIDEVPMDFLNIYTNNIIQGLQDFSGLSVSSTGKLFSSYNTFEACVDDNVPVLFSKNEFTIETGNNNDSNTIQYYLKGIEFPHKECPRYLHIDIGVANDAYGIACCYKHGSKIVDGVEVPEFYYDFSLRIVPPPPPKRVSISRCHEFIKYMRDELGLNIALVSFDQFQSEGSRQYLNEIGIKTVYQSVDKTDTQYLFFVDCLYKNCVHFSGEFAEAIRHELFELIWLRSKRKVDHPSGGTSAGHFKDRMDAVVGALYNAYTTKEAIINTNDILNLSLFNSEVTDYPVLNAESFDDFSESIMDGIKVISLKDL